MYADTIKETIGVRATSWPLYLFTREDDARYVLRLLIPVRFIRANPRLILQFNRHYRGPRLNAVPKILQANVFILGMLVVVVIRDRNCQRYRLYMIGNG